MVDLRDRRERDDWDLDCEALGEIWDVSESTIMLFSRSELSSSSLLPDLDSSLESSDESLSASSAPEPEADPLADA